MKEFDEKFCDEMEQLCERIVEKVRSREGPVEQIVHLTAAICNIVTKFTDNTPIALGVLEWAKMMIMDRALRNVRLPLFVASALLPEEEEGGGEN